MGISNNPEEDHRGNPFFSNIKSGSSYTGRNKLMQCLGYRIQPRRELGIDAKTVELVGRVLGISNYTVGRVSVETCSKIQ